jgi:hypothetical protein
MTESLLLQQKTKSLLRYILEKKFCYHNYREIYKMDTTNLAGQVVEISVVRECTICGKTKHIKI